MDEPRPIWRIVVAASALLALGVHLGAAPAPLRLLAVFWFVLVCPGMAFVRLLRLADPVAEGTLAVAVSLSVLALSSELLAVARLWSPTGLLAGLAGLTLVGAALPFGHRGRLRALWGQEVRP